jgi:MFS family permease
MHQGDQQELRHHHFRLKYTELNEIYIFNSLRTLAFSFITIFIPIYLLSLGFTIQSIFIYYISFYLMESLCESVSVRLIRILGPKHVIALSVPFMFIHFFLLQTLSQYNWSLWVVAITGAIALGLYWQAYHYDFSKAKRRKSAGKDVSRSYALVFFMSAFAPFIGGYVSDNYGVFMTFMIVIFLLLVGTLALFKTGDNHSRARKIDLSLLDFNEIKKDIVARAGLGWEASASMIIWPLFIYLIFDNYQSIGAVTSISMLAAMFIVHFIGKKVDIKPDSKPKIIKFGSSLKSIVYLLKVFVSTVLGVYLINIVRSAVGAFLLVGWDSEYYLHADEESRSEYLYVMELVIDFARALYFIILLVASFYLSYRNVLLLGFLMGSFGALVAGIMPLSKREEKIMEMSRKFKESTNLGRA